MIDKIVITLADTGFVNVNIGDVHFMHTDNMNEIIRNIAAAIPKLAYFPKSEYPSQNPQPISYEDFKKQYSKKAK